jgi:hypothetical protein
MKLVILIPTELGSGSNDSGALISVYIMSLAANTFHCSQVFFTFFKIL